MHGPSTPRPADGGQLEDEPQPPRGRRPGPEARLDARRQEARLRARSRSSCCRRSPTCARVQTLVDGDRLEIRYGAQDVSAHDAGAYTGEISAAMLAKLGCSYVVVGHSERREYHAEDDAIVNAKATKALDAGDDARSSASARGSRSARTGATSSTRSPSSTARWPGSSAEQVAGLVVAYEPVWAIGTGEVATPDDAQEVCAAIRARIAEALVRGRRGRRPHPVRRLGQGRQRRRDHGEARRRRLPGRRREPAGRRVRRHLPVLRHARHLTAAPS